MLHTDWRLDFSISIMYNVAGDKYPKPGDLSLVRLREWSSPETRASKDISLFLEKGNHPTNNKNWKRSRLAPQQRIGSVASLSQLQCSETVHDAIISVSKQN